MRRVALGVAAVCTAAALGGAFAAPLAQASGAQTGFKAFFSQLFSPLLGEAGGDRAATGAPDRAASGAEGAFDLVRDLLLARAGESGDVSALGITVGELDEALAQVRLDPALGYYDGCSYTYFNDAADHDDCTVSSFTLRYSLTAEELAGYDEAMDAALEAAVADARAAQSDVDAVRAVHDYLVRTCAFDQSDAAAASSAYGALVYGLATNHGYADAFCLAMERLGIPAAKVCDEDGIAWAMVQVDGSWYHVDACWDDPSPDQGPDAQVAYTYFLVSDEVMEAAHAPWQSDLEAPVSYRETVVGATPEERQAFATGLVRSMVASFTPELDDLAQYGLTVAEVTAAFDEVADGPLYAYVDEHWLGYTFGDGQDEDDGVVGRVSCSYLLEPQSADEYWDAVEEGVRRALSVLTDDMGDYDKALALHDYLVRSCRYDEEAPAAAHTAYGALVQGAAVCDGYARAYAALLERAGVACLVVGSTAMDHVWNLVQLDGAWYHVDVTWDDPVPDRGSEAEPVRTHFLVGDDTMGSLGYWGWVSPHAAPSDYGSW